MSWNEPGGNNRDPWSGGGGGGGRNQGPPDLDEVFRKFKERLEGMFGNRGGDSGGGGQEGGGKGGFGMAGMLVLVVVAVVIWLASGLYIVEEGRRGVVTRFGAYAHTTMPGLHWRIPTPVDAVQEVNVSERRRITIGYEAISPSRTRPVLSEALMLTADENIVNVQLAVQYQVSDPAQYLFTFRDPDLTLKEVTESALREVVGKRNLDFVLTEGRAEVQQETRAIVQDTMDRYEVGVQVVEVVIQDVQPPEQVQDAFLDAIKAREDKERTINEAQAYRNEVIPRAQGAAARVREEAQGYRERVIAQAEGDGSRFTQLLTEYRLAPSVTRERLYLDTMQEVLGRTGKIIMDTEGGNDPLLYLPIDRLMRGVDADGSRSGGGDPSRELSGSATSQADPDRSSTDSRRLRIRETR